MTSTEPVIPTWVVMAKYPQPGQVNTRLIAPGFLDREQAAQIARAMLRCVVSRVMARGEVYLAVSPDNRGEGLVRELELKDINVMNQGAGDLGERMERVWQELGKDRPVAFFGMDSPDIPGSALAMIPRVLEENDLALGPTPDGGYWTLAGRKLAPAVLRGIDWGGDRVYQQTGEKAHQAGLSVFALPEWSDVDYPADLRELRRRLAGAILQPDIESSDKECFGRILYDLDFVWPGLVEGDPEYRPRIRQDES